MKSNSFDRKNIYIKVKFLLNSLKMPSDFLTVRLFIDFRRLRFSWVLAFMRSTTRGEILYI
jgi:hypothetical protein